MKIKEKLKKILSGAITAAMALSLGFSIISIPSSANTANESGITAAETAPQESAVNTDEAPVLYLEVSSTLTAQDTFAWTEYDHYNYREPFYSQLNVPKHIVYEGDNIKCLR